MNMMVFAQNQCTYGLKTPHSGILVLVVECGKFHCGLITCALDFFLSPEVGTLSAHWCSRIKRPFVDPVRQAAS
jgi:hypothetical protein